MITVTPLHLIGANERGATYTLLADHAGDFIFGTRKKGSINGQHYHKGLVPVKDPEIFYLLSGSINIRLKHVETGEEAELQAEGPCRILFPRLIWHEVEALTDISFLECNSLEEHAMDTFRL